jgi:hypothetical protein
MAADLHIHVLTDEFTEEHCRAFRSNILGSQDFRPNYDKQFERERGCDLFTLAENTPQVWVGEVSWLKAAFLKGGDEEFVPDPIRAIHKVIGENFPVIDDALIAQVKAAMFLPNKTQYSLAGADEILGFLAQNRGRKAFTISW